MTKPNVSRGALLTSTILTLVLSCSSADDANLVIPSGETRTLTAGTYNFEKVEIKGTLKIAADSDGSRVIRIQADEFYLKAGGLIDGDGFVDEESGELSVVDGAHILVSGALISIGGQIHADGEAIYSAAAEEIGQAEPGVIEIDADDFSFTGKIQADGGDGAKSGNSDIASTKGQDGGSVEIQADNFLTITGVISVTGGSGVNEDYVSGPKQCGPTSGGSGGLISFEPSVDGDEMDLLISGGLVGVGDLPPPLDTSCSEAVDGEDGSISGIQ